MFSISDALKRVASVPNKGSAFGVLLGLCPAGGAAVVEGCVPLPVDGDVVAVVDALYTGLAAGCGSSLPIGVVALEEELNAAAHQEKILETIAKAAFRADPTTKEISLIAFSSLKQLTAPSDHNIPPILVKFCQLSSQQLTKKAAPLKREEGAGTGKEEVKTSSSKQDLASLMLRSQKQGNVLVCAPSLSAAASIHQTVAHASTSAKKLPPPPLVMSLSPEKPSFYLPAASVSQQSKSHSTMDLILWFHKCKEEGVNKVLPDTLTCRVLCQTGSPSRDETSVPLFFGPLDSFVVRQPLIRKSTSPQLSGSVGWLKSGEDTLLPLFLSGPEKEVLRNAFKGLNRKAVALLDSNGQEERGSNACCGCGPPSGPNVKVAPAWAVYTLTAAMVVMTVVGVCLIVLGGMEEATRPRREATISEEPVVGM